MKQLIYLVIRLRGRDIVLDSVNGNMQDAFDLADKEYSHLDPRMIELYCKETKHLFPNLNLSLDERVG